jgi:hypothetical protein
MIDLFPADQQPQVGCAADAARVACQTLLRKNGADGGPRALVEPRDLNLIREGKTIQIPASCRPARAGCPLNVSSRLVDARRSTWTGLAAWTDDLVRRYRSGLTLAALAGDASRFRVVAVKEASPASEAGLERGDLLSEVDQKPCGHMTLEELRVIFKMDGRRLLVVERGGKRIKLTFEMKR